MRQGTLLSIFLHESGAGTALTKVEEAEVREGGLVGDRYFGARTGGKTPDDAEREVTLIESEAIEAIEHESRLHLEPIESRRNLLTRDVPLNHLVNREFTVGEVRLRGIRLCEPCKHLEALTQPGILKALLHRGGLRAEVVSGGKIRVGDPIRY